MRSLRRLFWRCVAPRDLESPAAWTVPEAPGEAFSFWSCADDQKGLGRALERANSAAFHPCFAHFSCNFLSFSFIFFTSSSLFSLARHGLCRFYVSEAAHSLGAMTLRARRAWLVVGLALTATVRCTESTIQIEISKSNETTKDSISSNSMLYSNYVILMS